jgi:hypothetical protein
MVSRSEAASSPMVIRPIRSRIDGLPVSSRGPSDIRDDVSRTEYAHARKPTVTLEKSGSGEVLQNPLFRRAKLASQTI